MGDVMQIQSIASEIFEAARSVSQIEPFSKRGIQFPQSEAYAVAQRVTELRGGEVIGRKIGFTNRSIWSIYNVHEPMWGAMTNQTVEYYSIDRATVSLSKFCEPRIEPEIVIGLSKVLPRSPSIEDIVSCVEWIAPGFEIVDSIYPNWDFALNDTIACGGLHGRLVIGQKLDPPENLDQSLNNLKVALSLDGVIIEKGQGTNVLDGPISALKYLQEGIAKNQAEADLKSGDIVTTGTLTDAKPIFADQIWSAEFEGLETIPLEIKFTT
tara:strand:+ start:247 stop:1050 length:804 start_codon:yes stop_codon:yes gene_type:complete